MLKVSSSQYGVFFGDQLHLPCSIATVLGHAMQFVDLEPLPTFVDKRTVDEDAERCRDSDWLLCSCYCWNWRTTCRLAKRVKETNPRCQVVFGGPEVPDRATDFFSRHPYVDAIVHGEGEGALADYLVHPSERVAGVETRVGKGSPRERIKDLDSIPSPLTSGLMWRLAERGKHRWVASWETNRGCPFRLYFLRLGKRHQEQGAEVRRGAA